MSVLAEHNTRLVSVWSIGEARQALRRYGPARLAGMETRMPPAHRLLELGCGPEPAGDTRIGIDLDEDTARAAATTGIPCIAADARRLPFADGSVDGVLARGVLHHILDLAVVLGEVRRVLQPSGFLIAVDALPMPAARYRQMSRQLTGRRLPAEPRNGIDPDELTALATAAGFLPPQWSVSGDWTHATPPYADRVFASPAVTYTIKVPARP